jgi:hypothetical protein
MRKSRYRYKRYFLPLPKAIGDLLDTRVDYVVQLFGPAIVFMPKGLENLLSRLENLEKPDQENTARNALTSTGSVIEE